MKQANEHSNCFYKDEYNMYLAVTIDGQYSIPVSHGDANNLKF